MKAIVLVTLMIMFSSCEDTLEFDYSITEKLSEEDAVIQIKNTYETWNQVILFKNYQEAGDISINDFLSLSELICEYEKQNTIRWYYQFHNVEITAFQYDMNDNLIGAWIKGELTYHESVNPNKIVFDRVMYSTVIITKKDKDNFNIKLSYFAKGSREPYWWLNSTGNGILANDYYLKIYFK